MATKAGIIRGCGTRVHGGIYAESKHSPFGKPIEFFLLDPPIPINMDELGLSTIGVKLIERAGVFHVFDYVGEQHYPNVADFIEEARRFGASRRLPRSLEFSKLSYGSKLILIHRKAIIHPAEAYHADRRSRNDDGGGMCPHLKPAHWEAAKTRLTQTCAGLWWEDVEQGAPMGKHSDLRAITRAMPSFDYEAWRKPDGLVPTYEVGAFAAMPITNLAVVRDPEGSHTDAYKAAARAGLTTEMVEE